MNQVLISIILLFSFFSCNKNNMGFENKGSKKLSNTNNRFNISSKIKVLNFGTFHMSETDDAFKSEFDIRNNIYI